MATKLVRKAGQKSLKSQGAGYSTTNRKGETSFYKSGSDAPGFTDNSKGKAPISKFDASGAAITPESLSKTDVATVPTPPVAPNIGDVVGANNTGLETMISGLGYTRDTNGLFVAPKETAGSSNDMSGLVNAFNNYLGASEANAPVNQEAIYNKTLRQSGVQDAQRQVNNYTAQLNSIVAKSQAEQLGLEGQGRGVTESIIGGQQAQINREAAIAALPVQAQLAAAQGNLEFAQKQLDTLFTIRSADAKAKYDYNSNLISSVYNFATTVEQSRLNALKTKEDRAYSEKQQSIAEAKSLAMQAMEYGQSGLAARLMNLDQNSPTYSQDVSKAITELRKPIAASGSTSAESVVATDGRELVKVTPKEIQDLNDTQIAKNSLVSLADSMIASIEKKGTKVLWGAEAGARDSAKTNLLLAMKNLEKTGALDKGTIDVLSGTIPGNTFFATEAAQIAALKGLRDTVTGKVDEYVNSYRGTTAEIDPRTARIYQAAIPVNVADDDLMDIESIFTPSQSTASISPAVFY